MPAENTLFLICPLLEPFAPLKSTEESSEPLSLFCFCHINSSIDLSVHLEGYFLELVKNGEK